MYDIISVSRPEHSYFLYDLGLVRNFVREELMAIPIDSEFIDS